MIKLNNVRIRMSALMIGALAFLCIAARPASADPDNDSQFGRVALPGIRFVAESLDQAPAEMFAETSDLPRALAPLLSRDHGVHVSATEWLGDLAASVDVVGIGIERGPIAGEQIWVDFHYASDDGLWHPLAARRRVLCARGPHAHQWTQDSCP